MKKRLNEKRKYIAGIILIVVLAIGGVLAYLTDEVVFTNTFSMANSSTKVDIAASETTDGTTPYSDPSDVMPGDTIPKIPAVGKSASTNADCWVRAKVEFTQPAELGTKTALSTAHLQSVGAGWTLKTTDDPDIVYYYLNTGLTGANTNKVDLFTGVTIPDDWDNSIVGSTAKVRVTFQAIQKNNIAQNISSATPWGNITDSDIIAAQ